MIKYTIEQLQQQKEAMQGLALMIILFVIGYIFLRIKYSIVKDKIINARYVGPEGVKHFRNGKTYRLKIWQIYFGRIYVSEITNPLTMVLYYDDITELFNDWHDLTPLKL